MWSRRRPVALLGSAIAVAALSSAFLGQSACSSGSSGGATTATSAQTVAPPSMTPTVRLYLMSTVAGALVPCGCSKDQLGGADRFAAQLGADRARVPNRLLLGAGPLFFQEPVLSSDLRRQDEWKAEALADAMKRMGLVAWAPGANDFAAGHEAFDRLRAASGANFVGANLGLEGVVPSTIVEVGGVSIGIVGLSDPTAGQREALAKRRAELAASQAPAAGSASVGARPAGSAVAPTPSPAPAAQTSLDLLAQVGIEVAPPKEALRAEVEALRQKGARVVVGLFAMPRGEALRLLDDYAELDVVVIGKASEKGDGNDAPKPAVLLENTVVVETSNHLQTVAVLDLFVREPDGSKGRVRFADAGGVARAEQFTSLAARIRDLETRISGWEQGRTISPADLGARRADLERLRQERRALEAEQSAPPSGSYFAYSLVEIRDSLGKDADVASSILAFRKRVNEHSKVAFADRKPEPAPEGTASYLGIEACSDCHRQERAVWDQTQHARAYATLEKEQVEFNLECVGCHVTGYDRPGGSTVTHVEKLKDVGCEVCHGPGSRHAADPSDKSLIVRRPEPKTCVSECHHPPHVENFDPVAKMQLVLGPGHGR
jgi:hypothetical protein